MLDICGYCYTFSTLSDLDALLRSDNWRGVFLTFVPAEWMYEEHHEGLGSLFCCFSVLPQHYTQKSYGRSCTSEPYCGINPEPEEGVFTMHAWDGGKNKYTEGRSDDSRLKVRENVLGNNILKLPDKIFLGLHRNAPRCWIKTRTLLWYFSSFFCLFVCSLFTHHSQGKQELMQRSEVFLVWNGLVIIVYLYWFPLSGLSGRCCPDVGE